MSLINKLVVSLFTTVFSKIFENINKIEIGRKDNYWVVFCTILGNWSYMCNFKFCKKFAVVKNKLIILEMNFEIFRNTALIVKEERLIIKTYECFIW